MITIRSKHITPTVGQALFSGILGFIESQQLCDVDAVIIPILPIRELKLNNVQTVTLIRMAELEIESEIWILHPIVSRQEAT